MAFKLNILSNDFYQVVRKWVEQSDVAMALSAWQTSRHVLTVILVASLLINLLSLAFPIALLQVYDRIIPNQAISTLVLLVIGVLSALAIEGILRIIRAYVSAWSDAKFEHTTGCRAFNHLIHSQLSGLEKEGAGVHLKRLNALNQLRDFYSGQAITAIADIPFILLLFALLAYIGSWLVIIPLVMLGVLILLTVLQSSYLQRMIESKQKHDDLRFNFIIEVLSNIHTVKSNTMEAQMMRRYERLQRISSINSHDIILNSSKASIFGGSISQITIILVVALGSVMVIHGALTIGGMAACTLLAGRCLQPINSILQVWSRIKTVNIALKDLQQIFAMPQDTRKNMPDITHVVGDIRLEDVCFKYDGMKHNLVDHLNLHIKPGEAIAITGEGQSGKSTLLWLLMGIAQPASGKIYFDGRDIEQFNTHSLRRFIGYMPQNGVLYNGTIMQNLTMFHNKKHYDRAKQVAHEIGLDEIVHHLPKGFDTMVAGQAVEQMSHGIRQRIAIARALVNQPPIVIFDEANTAMDMSGDTTLKNLLQDLIGKCTLIIISHRPSILKIAQTHYLFKDGKLHKQ